MLNQLIDFFKQFFSPGNPEIQKNQQLKAIDTRLTKADSSIYKNGFVQVGVAKAFYTLYSNIGMFASLLDFVQLPEQKLIKNRVYDELIKTGYSAKVKAIVDSLSYETRKESFDAAPNRDEEEKKQAQNFLVMQKELHTTDFAQIEKTLQDLELFYDLSCFNFIDILKRFDPAFSPIDSNQNFQPVACDQIADDLLNFYFVSAKVHLTGSLARAIIAIASFFPNKANNLSQDELMVRLKKIATVMNKILNTDTLRDIIALGKRDAEIKPEYSVNKSTPLEEYSIRQKTLFNSDSERLSMEYQDQERSREIHDVFGEKPLFELNGYNAQTNAALQQGSSFSFLWITPVQAIKTFVVSFLGEEVQSLLNDIIVEGFFSTTEIKTDFSSAVFESLEIVALIQGFENSFARNEKNDSALIASHIKDSQKDPEFARALGNMVFEINDSAKKMTQKCSTKLLELYSSILMILEDSRRSTPEIVTNIKFLFTSSRNRDIVESLDKSMPKWAAFLNLMKHYAQLGTIETTREEQRQQSEE